MSSVDNAARSNFFPNSKNAQVDRIKQQQQARMLKNRNDVSRANELKSSTGRDAKVDINDAIRDFSRIRKAVDAAPERNNADKIAQLKQKIQAGTYKVDYDALADKVLRQEF
jgi:negative regulator of flagellin synthesis FlgM